jgi:hypothetical protein
MKVDTPEGGMFVNVMEDSNGRPVGIQLIIGKAGHTLSAWAITTSALLTGVLERGGSINDIITMLSSQKTEKTKVNKNGITCSSGPEGIYIALLRYKREKYQEHMRNLGITQDDDDDDEREASLNNGRDY